ncbi:MAG: amino acid adenylation domain-containing protein, partial [Candidatus Binatia bacterium]|nr:amino acid adenylation domain-containing protein [Candidatus Binatia bacterium]
MSDYAKDVCLHRLFEAQVERTPDAVAVTFENKQLTYRELNRRANQLAHYLKKLGVGPEVLVGICVERSPEMIIGILGVLKAGGAYVPLDPAYPKERLAFILEDSQASILLTQQRLAGSLAERSARVICLDADWDDIVRESDKDTSRGLLPGNLAYVLYTSGSTGKPKGVAIEHKSAAAFLSWAHIVFTPQQLAGVLASTSICFDLSVFELFAPLTSGGKVIVAEDVLALPKLRTPSEVTLVNTVPSALAELLRVNGIPPSVRTINLAGEPLSAKLVQQIYEATSAENVYDLYGPSEATTYSTWAIRTPEGPQTIGKPISNTQIYILDDHLNPVPLGVAGELHIGGAGLARGYWNQPELTAEKFIPDPFGDQPGARLYKTGDVARYLPDGNIEFLGRIDHQVKIRGFRIELGEIESVLCQHPAVQQAVVLAREDIPREKQLVAYLVPKESTPTTNDLRSFLQQKLPDYMVPSFFVFLDALPLTPNGKIDRKALPAPDQTRPDLAAPFVAPRTPVEEVLEDIWAEVLGLTQIGIHDNFLELGGHSLRATQIASRVRDAFQVELPLPCLFATPTIAGLAKIIEGSNARVENLSFPPIQPIPRSDDLPLSFSQERAWFIQQLDPANLAYNFQATLRFTGSLDVAALEQSLNEMVRRHEVFRTTFPAAQGRPIQVIHPFQPAHLPVVDLQALCESERESEAQRWIHEELRKPFDLTQLPMIRWILLRLSEQETILLHVEHHLVHDGWSFTV